VSASQPRLSSDRAVDFRRVSYFDRDVECVRRFFRNRFRYHSDERPRFSDVVPEHMRKITKLAKNQTEASHAQEDVHAANGDVRLDLLAKASGFGGSKHEHELEKVRCRPLLLLIPKELTWKLLFYSTCRSCV
jgi:hypothetical protein